ncbi:MAG: hypothetical protein LBM67_05225 [Lentimicrobiaceae bacterium]|jgi:hypothetical protein|nr:hypothetical protein [Lentimicrobiaceae bacterium]
MKKANNNLKWFFLLILFVCLMLSANHSLAQSEIPEETVSIPMYGKAGAVYENGSWKICPGFAFKKCASVEISFKDIWNYLFKSNEPGNPGIPNFPVVVDLYDDEEQLINTILLQGVLVLPTQFSSEETIRSITADDIILN